MPPMCGAVKQVGARAYAKRHKTTIPPRPDLDHNLERIRVYPVRELLRFALSVANAINSSF